MLPELALAGEPDELRSVAKPASSWPELPAPGPTTRLIGTPPAPQCYWSKGTQGYLKDRGGHSEDSARFGAQEGSGGLDPVELECQPRSPVDFPSPFGVRIAPPGRLAQSIKAVPSANTWSIRKTRWVSGGANPDQRRSHQAAFERLGNVEFPKHRRLLRLMGRHPAQDVGKDLDGLNESRIERRSSTSSAISVFMVEKSTESIRPATPVTSRRCHCFLNTPSGRSKDEPQFRPLARLS